jgi:hypothetical protein
MRLINLLIVHAMTQSCGSTRNGRIGSKIILAFTLCVGTILALVSLGF